MKPDLGRVPKDFKQLWLLEYSDHGSSYESGNVEELSRESPVWMSEEWFVRRV